jgi:Na+/melibiose symporter-like transporter
MQNFKNIIIIMFRLVVKMNIHDDILSFYMVWVYGVSRHFQQYFSYIVAVSIIGRGNRRTGELGENHRPVASH